MAQFKIRDVNIPLMKKIKYFFHGEMVIALIILVEFLAAGLIMLIYQ